MPSGDAAKPTHRPQPVKRRSVISCTMRNVSSSGALLVFATMVGMPSDFEILIDGSHKPHRVVWRSNTRMGVAWTDLKAAARSAIK